MSKQWCVPEVDGEFVARMEDLLALYARPYDPAEPVVGFDECPVQLLADVRLSLPAQPGQPARQDYEYIRNGSINLLLLVEPLTGWRDLEVSEQRTKLDFARRMAYLVDERYPDARRIHVVLDNLNTHILGALYEAFPASDAFRIAQKLRFHPTPKHGSWLNVSEIELSVFSRRCLSRRVPSPDALRALAEAYEDDRNRACATIQWRFSVFDARSKLARLYPANS